MTIGILTVLVATLRVRSGPSTTAGITGSLSQGEHAVTLYESGIESAGYSWARIGYENNTKTGYVAMHTLELTGTQTLATFTVTDTDEPEKPPPTDAEVRAAMISWLQMREQHCRDELAHLQELLASLGVEDIDAPKT